LGNLREFERGRYHMGGRWVIAGKAKECSAVASSRVVKNMFDGHNAGSSYGALQFAQHGPAMN
jgi:hypothetical protein